MLKEIFSKKIGMTQVFNEEGNVDAVTLLEVEPVCVLEKKEYATKKKALIGCFKVSPKKMNKVKKPLLGYYTKGGIPPYQLRKEVTVDGEVEAKQMIGIEMFTEGDTVDVRARTKGRGFTGGMKRYGWHGQPRSHGSTTHRRIGSAGASAYPSRVIRGHRMPGHMGNVSRTIRNLTVAKIDKEKRLLFIKGAVPGGRGTIVKVKIVNKVQVPEEKKE